MLRPIFAFAFFLSSLALCADAPPPHIRLVPYLTGFTKPLACVDDGSGRMFIVEQAGRIRVAHDGMLEPAPFLDISDIVYSRDNETGLLGLAFHPQFKNNGRFFLNYTTKINGKLESHIMEFKADPRSNQADPKPVREILHIDQPFSNHNGGNLEFGPDGMLYAGFGDGGSGGDPLQNGQNLGVLLGKMLRLDVDHGDPYGIPKDNPFVNRSGARPEIFAYGLRNPWRFSFDRKTGQLWCGDVGQNIWEEVDIIESGKNYGWSAREGTHDFKPERAAGPLTEPIKDYSHKVGQCVVGGYVYRGKQMPELEGVYIYADYQNGKIFALKWDGHALTLDTMLMQAPFNISSFGEDKDGELYVCDQRNGRILRVAQ